jgi:hypothetical protein
MKCHLRERSIQMISKDRQLIRDAFKSIKDDEINHHIKDQLISILPNETQKSSFQETKIKKKLSIINAILNRKIFKKKIMKIPKSEKIVFYNFLENSLSDKNLLHCHSIMRIPLKFKHRLQEIIKLLIEIVRDKFDFKVSVNKRRNAIAYCTKNFNENNDRFYVC